MVAFAPDFISNLCRGSHIHVQLLLRAWHKQRMTVLLITPAADEAILFSDLVYVMTTRLGKLKTEIQVDY